MSKLIFISGNDGSGKSTFSLNLVSTYSKENKTSLVKHFYNNPLRRVLRKFIGSGDKKKETVNNLKRNSNKGIVLLLFYYFYSVSIIVFMNIEKFLNRKYDYIIYDRSFIDELISIEVIKGIAIGKWFYYLLLWLTSYDKYYLLDANTEMKFDRIYDKDISFEKYLKKEKLYRSIFGDSYLRRKRKIKIIKTENFE